MGFRWRRPRRVVIGVLAAGVLLAGGGVTAWALASQPGPFTERNIRIPVLDGPGNNQHVVLDATLFRPAGPGRLPAVLLAHGFGETKAAVRGEAIGLARAGFAVLTWSARGFGRSTGQIALDSPDYEVKDTEQLVSWLARQPGILLDHPGDPRVGIAGASYGGAIALLTAGVRPPDRRRCSRDHLEQPGDRAVPERGRRACRRRGVQEAVGRAAIYRRDLGVRPGRSRGCRRVRRGQRDYRGSRDCRG